MGAATAAALAPRGPATALFEQFETGHRRGSSHGTSRIFRLSYRDPHFVALAQDARRAWDALERSSGHSLRMILGGFDVGAGIEANVRALSACDAPFELVDGAAAARRWPHLGFEPGEPVVFQPDAGIVAADRAWRALTGAAASAGAAVLEGVRVERLEVVDGGVDVVAGDRTVRARVAVVTAGSWAAPLLAAAGIELPVRVTRETVAYYPVDGPPPEPLVEWGEPSFYGLAAPALGLKAGVHHAGLEADPDVPGDPDPGRVAEISDWVARRYPRARPEPAAAETCMYTSTPDQRFILERRGPIVVGSACSGHGFKFAPVIGERLADLAAL